MARLTEVQLVGNFDAAVWAREFVATVREHPGIPTDEATMLGWFANAIMAGYDEATRRLAARQSPPEREQ